MSTVEIGLGIQADKPLPQYGRLAALAESHGFDVLSVFADLMYQPPIGALLEIARATERVRLGPACWNPYSMHPYEIAGQLAALDAASGGRAYLGLARGTWLGDIGIGQPRPVAYLKETVGFVQALLSGSGEGYEGELFRLAPDVRLRYAPYRPHIPLLIGAWGPQTLAWAGRIAQEVKIGGTANPAVIDVMRRRIEPGLAHRGPVPPPGIVVGAVTVVDEDGTAARAHARREAAMYLAVVADLDPTIDVPGELLARMKQHLMNGDHAGAGRLIPDELLDLFAFCGTPEQVTAQAQRLIDAGVARIEFGTPHGFTDAHGIELLGTRVLPALRG